MLYVMRVVALPIVCQAKRSRSRSLCAGAALLLLFAACARTGLHPGDLSEGDDGPDESSSGGRQATPGAGGSSIVAGGMAGTAGIAGMLPTPGSAGAPTQPTEPICRPRSEACNGRDDDCNGAVDDLPAEACDGGGFRFCVAGRMSECPRRCEVCVPGSVRVCQNPYCTFWGEQECAADGQGFGNCREADPPPECADIARKHQQSPELEQCCLDNGYCCEDEHDLDNDGNRREMLGACEDIACQ
jgi:hypothetical protein